MSESQSKQKTEKQHWAEKKRHGNAKEQRAAVSVQIGRMADRLLERADGLEGKDISRHAREAGVSEQLTGPKDGQNSVESTSYAGSFEHFAIGSKEKSKTSLISRKTKTKRTIQVDYMPSYSKNAPFEVDPEGKREPSDVYYTAVTGVPASAESMVNRAAPVMRQIKRDIDYYSQGNDSKDSQPQDESASFETDVKRDIDSLPETHERN